MSFMSDNVWYDEYLSSYGDTARKQQHKGYTGAFKAQAQVSSEDAEIACTLFCILFLLRHVLQDQRKDSICLCVCVSVCVYVCVCVCFEAPRWQPFAASPLTPNKSVCDCTNAQMVESTRQSRAQAPTDTPAVSVSQPQCCVSTREGSGFIHYHSATGVKQSSAFLVFLYSCFLRRWAGEAGKNTTKKYYKSQKSTVRLCNSSNFIPRSRRVAAPRFLSLSPAVKWILKWKWRSEADLYPQSRSGESD